MSKFLKRAKELNLKAKTTVFSEYVGSHISKKKGEGYDFSEIKEYTYGDDIRHMDWTISAKLGSPHIKLFNEENKLFIEVISLLNGSCYFGSVRQKQDLIAEIVGTILYSGFKKKDIIKSTLAHNHIVYESPIVKRASAIEKEIENILQFQSLGKIVDLKEIGKRVIEKTKRKSLIILVGDFLDGFEKAAPPNLSYLAKKHEVIAIVVRDKIEETLGEISFGSFVDPVNKKSLETSLSKQTKMRYKERLREYDKKLFTHFHKLKIISKKIYTDDSVGKELRKVFR